jgi:hypothetical protein
LQKEMKRRRRRLKKRNKLQVRDEELETRDYWLLAI